METARLAAIPLFGTWRAPISRRSLPRPRRSRPAAGERVVSEGDFGHALYAIESGTADVSANGAPVASLGPGDVFGEIAVLASGRRTASVVATSPMRLIALFKPAVWALDRKAPETAARLRALIAERRPSGL